MSERDCDELNEAEAEHCPRLDEPHPDRGPRGRMRHAHRECPTHVAAAMTPFMTPPRITGAGSADNRLPTTVRRQTPTSAERPQASPTSAGRLDAQHPASGVGRSRRRLVEDLVEEREETEHASSCVVLPRGRRGILRWVTALRELEQHLIANGCERARHGSRSDVWPSPTANRPVTVPRHREIPFGTARAICCQLGIPVPPQ